MVVPIIPIAVTMGEPAGISGDITLYSWQRRHQEAVPVFFVIDDADRLQDQASLLDLSIPIERIEQPGQAYSVFSTALPVLHMPLPVKVNPGRPTVETVQTVAESINRAVAFCQTGQASAVVTNPIHKDTMYQGGFRYPGHTEYLAHLAKISRSVMMLSGGGVRTVPVTVHLSLKQAIERLSIHEIVETCTIVDHALRRDFGLKAPRITLSGLNPHAGESGSLGREEIDIIRPAIEQLRKIGILAKGPLSADTLFHPEARASYDVAICMTHDQALIPVKTLDFHGGVNITLGMSFIRTSPDHGTAFDLAGSGKANPYSFINALHMARRMADNRMISR